MSKILDPYANDGGLVPPGQGAFWGQMQNPGTLVADKLTWSDDKHIASQSQTPSGSVLNEYYCYWVNGGTEPYYVVIQRQTLTISPGQVIVKDPDSIGFFQYALAIENSVLDGGGQPLSGALLTNHSPVNFSPSSPPVAPPVALNVPMVLLINQGGSLQPTEFTATDQESVTLDDWGIDDLSTPVKNGLLFHQVTTWNSGLYSPAKWPEWYLNAYDQEIVRMLPSTSFGTLQLSVLLAWQMKPAGTPAPDAPPPYPLQFKTSVTHSLAALHNPAACNTEIAAVGGLTNIKGGHHLKTVDIPYTPIVVTGVDLQSIVNQHT